MKVSRERPKHKVGRRRFYCSVERDSLQIQFRHYAPAKTKEVLNIHSFELAFA